jgi:hypothetical protein
MLSICLWRWYINITITILDIIHRPEFYLKLNSTLYVSPYLTRSIVRLRYEPNRLMLSIGLWRWYINITIAILHVIHRPVFYLIRNISETWYCLRAGQIEDRTMDNVQNTPQYSSLIQRPRLRIPTDHYRINFLKTSRNRPVKWKFLQQEIGIQHRSPYIVYVCR